MRKLLLCGLVVCLSGAVFSGVGWAAAPTNTTPPASQTAPKLSSVPLEIGQTLTVSTGTWSGTPPLTYSYTWYRCNGACVVIPGATGPSLNLTSLEQGCIVEALVTAKNAVGAASAYAPYDSWPVELPGGGALPHLAKAERQVHQAAGLGVSLSSLLKHNGYSISFLLQVDGVLQVAWTAVPHPGARAIRVAWLSYTASTLLTGPRTYKLKVRLTAKGRRLLKHDRGLLVNVSSIFEQINSLNGLYPVFFNASRTL